MDRRPPWVRIVIGALAIALGAAVLFRPTTSLGLLSILIGAGFVLTGVLELARVTREDGPTRFLRPAVAVLWVIAGILVLVYPEVTVRLIAVAVGVGLIVNGVIDVIAVFEKGRKADERAELALLGVAGIIFGVLALAWPDITLLIVAVVFGARLILGGAAEILRAIRRRPSAAKAGGDRRGGWFRVIGAALVLVLAVLAGAVSVALHKASPVVDDFYAAPRDVPSEPGQLIRSEPFTREVPSDATAWRILYTTRNGDGSPDIASGLVVVPKSGSGDWPVIDWDHGTTGYAQQCAPSLAGQPWESGALFLLPQIIGHGWALVATDYIGLGTPSPHPYLVGLPTAHASLDAVRAARQLTDAHLGQKTVVWGHSQGGGAALWTGAVADSYAPDVHLAGVAALAPASNLPALMRHLPDVTGGSIFASYVIGGYASSYPDISVARYVRPGVQTTLDRMKDRCLAEPGALVSVLTALGLSKDPEILSTDPTTGSFGKHLEARTCPRRRSPLRSSSARAPRTGSWCGRPRTNS
ncbi:DUF308 domain-containing protein [Leifsonia sp. AG29]|uniref:DUF308 domain-containing protein n=1 Tax=Leifsonia sp. AG29 TaxID=2598860 RepID=UPI0022790E64|nr:DUF308 domain-containing protein [Leifsonia sp. AG29]